MAESSLFSSLVDRGAFLAHEKQIRLAEIVDGHDQWDADLEVPSLTFTFADRTLVYQAQLLGSAAPGPDSWLWGWANDSVSGAGTEMARWLCDVGQRDRIPELCTPEIPLGPAGMEAPEAFWYRLVFAVTALVPDWDGYYAPDIGGGAIGPLLVRHPALALPPPDLMRVVRVLSEGVSTVRVTDHRAAVASYAALRGIACTGTADGCVLALPEGTLELTFDHLNRLGGLRSSTQ
ncbi:MAG: hypothetical protein FWF21_05730 [Micrococcales bacterium]|nr:hypothetical protein [Micrococcales bacterium]